MLPPSLPLAARTVLGATFLVSGAAKAVTSPGRMVATIRNYGVSGDATARIASRVLPAAEMILGLCIICGLLLPVASIAVISLLLVFNWLIYRSLRQGREFSCSCFGAVNPTPIGFGLILRNTGLLALGVLAAADGMGSGLSVSGAPYFGRYMTGLAHPAALLIYFGLLLLFISALSVLERSSVLFVAKPATGRSGD